MHIKFLPFYIEETCTSYSLFHNHGQDCNKLLFLCILTVKRSCRILLGRVYALQPIFSSFKLRRVKDRNSIGCNVLSSSFFGKVVIYGGLFLMLAVGLQKLQPCHCSGCNTCPRHLLHRCVALMDVNLLHISPYLLQLLHYMKEFTQQRRRNMRVNACEKCCLFAKVTQSHPNFLKKRRICYIFPKVTPISIWPKNDRIITNTYLFYSFIKYSVPFHKNRSTKPFSAKVTAAENPKHE